MTNYRDALEIVVSRTKNERLRELCAESHPDHEQWRAFIVARAGMEIERPAPPASGQIPLAGDLVASLAHAVGADRAAEWLAEKLTGVPDCHCDSRRRALNELDRKARRLVARLARRKPAR